MEIHGVEKLKTLSKLSYIAVRRPKIKRSNTVVLNEYESGWEQYNALLDNSAEIDDWLYLKGIEDQPTLCNINNMMHFGVYNIPNMNREALTAAIEQDFSNIESITEYGCGVGRNLLHIKRLYPHIQCYGYELCQSGVSVAQRASEKFGLSVEYAQLDYLKDPEEKYIFPKTDCAFTMYSLEQLSNKASKALFNIQQHVKLGSIHIEPVVENYPKSFRGLIARLDNWKVGYLNSFEKSIMSLSHVSFRKQLLPSSHNPLMFPSLYVVRKQLENVK